MEKLELKHLAPYLPYGLNTYCSGLLVDEYSDDPKPIKVEVTGLSKDFVTIHEIGRTVTEEYVYSDIYLILRPLSDLNKHIDDTEFTYYDKFCNLYGYFELHHTCNMFFPDLEEWLSFIDIINFTNNLFESHFDVFGLIPKGLAIDINTLEK